MIARVAFTISAVSISALMFFASGCAPIEKYLLYCCHGLIKGRIADERGNGVMGARIEYPEQELSTQITNETGEFVSHPLKCGRVNIRIWKEGYSALDIQPVIIKDDVITIDVIAE